MNPPATRFLDLLQGEAALFTKSLATETGDWVVKGFAEHHGYKLILASEQNFYPDITFVDSENNLFAVDIKTSYRVSKTSINGLTLGAFTGYFRNRNSTKNVTFAYDKYFGHFVLVVIYSRQILTEETKRYTLLDLESIPSAISDFQFFVQPKYRIAIDRPGSGNTKNIGSVTKISELVEGTGPFAELGEATFYDYWMHYLTADMARTVEMAKPPYNNLQTYRLYKQGGQA
jgi:hypothetical protein